MFNRKFSVITAGSLFAAIALASLPTVLGSKAIAATSAADTAQVETVDATYLAQRGGRGGGRRGGRWMEELNLTEAQKTEIQTIRERYRPQMESLRSRARNASGDDRQAIREEAKDLRDQVRGEIMQVLTPAQRQQARQLMEQRRSQRQERRRRRQGEQQ